MCILKLAIYLVTFRAGPLVGLLPLCIFKLDIYLVYFRAGPLVGLILISLSTGGIKPCVVTFGGEQFTADQVCWLDTAVSRVWFEQMRDWLKLYTIQKSVNMTIIVHFIFLTSKHWHNLLPVSNYGFLPNISVSRTSFLDSLRKWEIYNFFWII